MSEESIMMTESSAVVASSDSKGPCWKDGTPYQYEAVEGFDPSQYTPTEVIKRMQGLRKQVSEIGEKYKAPDEYKVDNSVFNVEDPIFKKYTEVAKNNNLSQAQYDSILELNKEQMKLMQDQQKAAQEKYYQSEIAKLGDNAKQRFDNIVNRVNQLDLPDEVKKEFPNSLGSASAVKAWEAIMAKIPQYSNVPGRDAAQHSPQQEYTQEGLRKLIGLPNSPENNRYYTDKSYAKTVRNYAAALEAQNNVQSKKSIFD